MIKIAIIEGKNIEFTQEYSSEDISIILKQIESLNSFDRDTQKFQNFKKVFNDFQELLRTNNLETNLSRIILELMASFRAFIDNWETFIKRKYGKDSDEIKSFKKATNDEYDAYFAYRFIYELRNYIQHVGQPNINCQSVINEKEMIDTFLFLNKKELTESYDKWKPIIKKDFSSLPENFDLIPLLTDLYNSVKRINDVAVNLNDIKTLYYSSLELIKLKRLLRNENCRLAIIEGEWDKPMPQKLKIMMIPMHIAEYVTTHITMTTDK